MMMSNEQLDEKVNMNEALSLENRDKIIMLFSENMKQQHELMSLQDQITSLQESLKRINLLIPGLVGEVE